MLGDVHLAHHLDAGHDGRVHVAPRAECFVHLAVDAKPHDGKLAAGLDMDVAGSGANRLHQQVVHEIDDRAAIDHGLHVGEVHFGGVGLELHGGFIQIRGDRVDFKAFFVAARQSALNAAAKRKHGPDF